MTEIRVLSASGQIGSGFLESSFARGISLKQQFVTPSGDSKTTYFTNIRYNQKVDTNAFAIKTNSKTVKDVH